MKVRSPMRKSDRVDTILSDQSLNTDAADGSIKPFNCHRRQYKLAFVLLQRSPQFADGLHTSQNHSYVIARYFRERRLVVPSMLSRHRGLYHRRPTEATKQTGRSSALILNGNTRRELSVREQWLIDLTDAQQANSQIVVLSSFKRLEARAQT